MYDDNGLCQDMYDDNGLCQDTRRHGAGNVVKGALLFGRSSRPLTTFSAHPESSAVGSEAVLLFS
jgi:hypothetical protein